MKTETIALTLAFCFLGGAACFAADPQMGTWKLNEAKSNVTPGTLKYNTVTVENMFGNVKVTAHGFDVHSEWTGNFDGKIFSYGRPVRRHSVVHQDR